MEYFARGKLLIVQYLRKKFCEPKILQLKEDLSQRDSLIEEQKLLIESLDLKQRQLEAQVELLDTEIALDILDRLNKAGVDTSRWNYRPDWKAMIVEKMKEYHEEIYTIPKYVNASIVK